MVLLDENHTLLTDDEHMPGEAVRQSLLKRGILWQYANETTLYHWEHGGELVLAHLSQPRFHLLRMSHLERVQFQREGRLATSEAVIRDIGCMSARIYMDTCSFLVPLELLK